MVRKETKMPKAYWRGHPVFQIERYENGWAKISFYDETSPITGTGCCYVREDDIVIEEEA